MKKTVKSILILAAGVITLAGCSKEIAPATEQGNQKTFTVNFPEDFTKTAIDISGKPKVVWAEGDAIGILNSTPENAKFTLTEGAGTTSGAFSGTLVGEATSVVYPYSENNVFSSNGIKVNLPQVQTVAPDTIDPSAAIMVGKIDEDDVINFVWVVGFFKITAPEDVTNLVSITISSGGATTGTFDVSALGYFQTSVKTTSSVTIKPASGKFEAGKNYYAAYNIPGGSYSHPKITYNYVDEETHTVTTKTKTASKSFTQPARGRLTPIPAVDMSAEGVEIHTGTQLEKDGLFFADFNVGSTITDYGNLVTDTSDAAPEYIAGALYCTENVGGLYAWHNAYDYPNIRTLSSDKHWDSSLSPSSDSRKDTASNLWGYSWAEPDDNFLEELANTDKYAFEYCDGSTKKYCDGCTLAGMKLTSKSENKYDTSIFLPFAGFYNPGTKAFEETGSEGCYWSAGILWGENKRMMYMTSSTGYSYLDSPRSYGFSVRAVFDINGPSLR